MRIKHWKSLLTGLLAVLAYASPTHAADPIGNFALLDVKGDFHQLNKYGYQDALVIVTQANGCEANYVDNFKYKLLETDYKNANISYLMLNIAGESREAVRQEAERLSGDAWPMRKLLKKARLPRLAKALQPAK